jgi:hypothetical protein
VCVHRGDDLAGDRRGGRIVDADRPGAGLCGDRRDRRRRLILCRLFGELRIFGADERGDEAFAAGGDEQPVVEYGEFVEGGSSCQLCSAFFENPRPGSTMMFAGFTPTAMASSMRVRSSAITSATTSS